MDPAIYATYVGVVAVLAVMPGTDNVYILTRTLSQGRRAGLLAATGIAMALSCHVGAVTFGLGQVFLTSPALYQAIRWAGIVYLVFLAWQAFRSANEARWDTDKSDRALCASRIIAQGFTLALLNPKLAVFFIAFLPQFTEPATGSVTVQLLVLGMTFALLSLVIFTTMIFAVEPLGHWLRRHSSFPAWQARATGGVLGIMAMWLALEGR